ncbi:MULTISPECIES: hypothetical protein [unclassified Streptomyces]|uniref:hypothetical protein n=1 Tax=unclassified Streptomyces TaxID=2593676 RepID=UPI0022549CFE|nr:MULTISPECIES: hypothetical protein [unclassified Streptomyces]MCX5151991.1 hypothetical protein [Streptomyces sp. NBC_00320]WSN47057.1 hypothetical protein OG299_04750 [Streptomyces sp. NBC_01296]
MPEKSCAAPPASANAAYMPAARRPRPASMPPAIKVSVAASAPVTPPETAAAEGFRLGGS